ncbi:PocR ligand-binding domain-containing protein [Candidatus Contubernalis alkaliaceticus]|uniref:PocR ligand-binding domain-containing protein n=1 Tax=Candidatus Contubernalis alkaliaceticus TaxID=338645 RepID=UPI001F4C3E39|nr:PocR ligand-binding domain-containing protein [Candidatus Contubernalis alkalaceticus]UNC92205.1 PocR ligand-binding domain-containing protein [Candidatus Contubernalis alkalaceticus]
MSLLRTTQGINEVEYLDKFLGSFCSATGLYAEAVTLNGDTLYAPEGLSRCQFCQIVRSGPGGVKQCRASYKRAATEASKWEEPYFFRCHAGLVIWAIPIIIRGEALGAIMCGQVLLWEPDDYFWQEQQFFNSKHDQFEKLILAVRKLEVVTPARTQAAADLLFVVVNHIVERNVRVLEDADQARKVQQEIRQEMERKKRDPKDKNLSYEAYLEKERELLRCIRLGDRTNAEIILSGLFADLFTKAKGKANEINQRTFELVCLVSRAAIEGGVDADRAMEVLKEYNKELKKVGDIFYQAKKTIEHYLDGIFALTNKKHINTVKKAREYIMENCSQSLTTQDIATHIYISPSHLSRLFRKELDCTVLEYLTRVRIEKALQLLKNNEQSIEEVARSVGFKNTSYFARIFKERVGVTPLTFRNSLF